MTDCKNLLQTDLDSVRSTERVISLTQKPHFMNAVRNMPEKFSCAVDSFLEMWLRVIHFHTRHDRNGCRFISLLKNVAEQYENLTEEGPPVFNTDLHRLREIVWSFLRIHCTSFAMMDCSAQFSEIFRISVFENMSLNQKESFLSQHTLSSYCDHCCKRVDVHSEIFLNYLSVYDFSKFNLSFIDWPKLLIKNNCSESIQCCNCEKQCDTDTVCTSLAAILFIEFSPDLMNVIRFESDINVSSKHYRLQAMVRNLGTHFSCAVMENNSWEYIDDLSERTQLYLSLNSLYQHSVSGWFFAVYILVSVASSVDYEYMNMTINQTGNVNELYNLKRKKYYHNNNDRLKKKKCGKYHEKKAAERAF